MMASKVSIGIPQKTRMYGLNAISVDLQIQLVEEYNLPSSTVDNAAEKALVLLNTFPVSSNQVFKWRI